MICKVGGLVVEKTLEDYLNLAYSFTVRLLGEEDGGLSSTMTLRGWHWGQFGRSIAGCYGSKRAWLEASIINNIPIPEPNTVQKYSGNYVLRMPKSLHQWIEESDSKEGVSTNQFVNHNLSMAKGRRTP